jgi:hypothetical protein
MLPQRPVDETDSNRNLLQISVRSRSFRIECMSYCWAFAPKYALFSSLP